MSKKYNSVRLIKNSYCIIRYNLYNLSTAVPYKMLENNFNEPNLGYTITIIYNNKYNFVLILPYSNACHYETLLDTDRSSVELCSFDKLSGLTNLRTANCRIAFRYF